MIRSLLKRAIQAPFRWAGLEVSRAQPDPALLFLRRHPFRTVLDIGAETGRFAALARAGAPDAWIHSFEPLEESRRKLERRMSGDCAFRAHPFALGETDGEAEMFHDDFSAASSLLAMTEACKEAYRITGSGAKITVRVRSLDGWAGENPLEDPLLLKVDAQGFEDRILRGGRRVLARAKAAIVEVSFVELYEGQPLFPEIDRMMREAGFSLEGIVGEARDLRTGLVLYADGFYARGTD